MRAFTYHRTPRDGKPSPADPAQGKPEPPFPARLTFLLTGDIEPGCHLTHDGRIMSLLHEKGPLYGHFRAFHPFRITNVGMWVYAPLNHNGYHGVRS